MPDADKGTVTATPDTAPGAAAADALEGFAEAFGQVGDPAGVGSGQPAEAKAVEASEKDDAPEVEKDTPAETPESEATEDKPDPPATVNFDGFSDDHKTTLARLLKAGHVTPEEIEVARKDALRQSYFSKRTADHNRSVEKWEKEVAERREDLALLDRIRGDDRLHEAWMKAAKGELTAEESAGDDLVDAKKATEIVDKRLDARERDRETRTTKQQAAYDAKRGSLERVVEEQSTAHDITPEAMNGYLKAIRARLPANVDPVEYLRADELRDRIETLHEAATAKAEAAKWRDQAKRTSKDERTSKQSLPPARRVTESRAKDAWSEMQSDLGIAPDWSNVQGMGHGAGR